MIYIGLIPSWEVLRLQNTVAAVKDAWAIEIKSIDFNGIPISLIAVKADKLIDDSITVLNVFPEPRLCPVCLKQLQLNVLPKHNRSGYCAKHQHKNPEMKKHKY